MTDRTARYRPYVIEPTQAYSYLNRLESKEAVGPKPMTNMAIPWDITECLPNELTPVTTDADRGCH
jgi:hypothetical protein